VVICAGKGACSAYPVEQRTQQLRLEVVHDGESCGVHGPQARVAILEGGLEQRERELCIMRRGEA
jgi:hypothetical protein